MPRLLMPLTDRLRRSSGQGGSGDGGHARGCGRCASCSERRRRRGKAGRRRRRWRRRSDSRFACYYSGTGCSLRVSPRLSGCSSVGETNKAAGLFGVRANRVAGQKQPADASGRHLARVRAAGRRGRDRQDADRAAHAQRTRMCRSPKRAVSGRRALLLIDFDFTSGDGRRVGSGCSRDRRSSPTERVDRPDLRRTVAVLEVERQWAGPAA